MFELLWAIMKEQSIDRRTGAAIANCLRKWWREPGNSTSCTSHVFGSKYFQVKWKLSGPQVPVNHSFEFSWDRQNSWREQVSEPDERTWWNHNVSHLRKTAYENLSRTQIQNVFAYRRHPHLKSGLADRSTHDLRLSVSENWTWNCGV